MVVFAAQAASGQGPSEGTPDAWGIAQWEPTDHFDRAELDRWASYRGTKRSLGAAGLALGLAFYVVLLGGAGRRLAAFAERLAPRLGALPLCRSGPARRVSRGLARLFGDDWAGAMLFVWGYLFLGVVVSLPLWILSELVDRRQGLSAYGPWEWVVDLAKAEAMAWASLSLLAFGLFGIVRRMPRRWWLAVGLVGGALLSAWGLASPLRTRAFHEVRPLEEGALRLRLEEVAARQGVSLGAINVVEASRVTTAMDAYVTGEGPTRELVLYDTLLDGLGPDEVVVAVAHEIGHEQRRRPLQTHLLAGGALLLLLWLLSVALRSGSRRLGLRGPGDVRLLPLVMLVVSLALLAARPARLAWSRHEERLADRAALVSTGDAEAFIRLQITLARANHADVTPHDAALLWYGSHPSTEERVGRALWYARWLERQRRPRAEAAR